jgi:hypothetical protein
MLHFLHKTLNPLIWLVNRLHKTLHETYTKPPRLHITPVPLAALVTGRLLP